MRRKIPQTIFAPLMIGLVFGWMEPTKAQTPPPLNVGSDGSDGVFTFVPDTPGGNVMTIDLALAASGLDGGGMPITWQTPSPMAGRGVYDPAIWAVVFKYSELTVPAGKTILFSNRAGRPPVVWLVQGTCTLAGVVSLPGIQANYDWPEPGPGGFRGGHGAGASANGFGWGGGISGSLSGLYNYGSAACFPLIGGSGSRAGDSCGGVTNYSAAGGGAILIAADVRIDLLANSGIYARGGFQSCGSVSPAGSGGAIRLVSDVISKDGLATLDADGSGTPGRIRVEGNTILGLITGAPTPSTGSPGTLLPDASTATLRVVSITIGGQTHSVPSDPVSDTNATSADLILSGSGSATFNLEARNVAPGTTCTLRVLDLLGAATTYTSTPLVGTSALSTATVTVPLGTRVYAIQARVVL